MAAFTYPQSSPLGTAQAIPLDVLKASVVNVAMANGDTLPLAITATQLNMPHKVLFGWAQTVTPATATGIASLSNWAVQVQANGSIILAAITTAGLAGATSGTTNGMVVQVTVFGY